jgi:hypothetical protein
LATITGSSTSGPSASRPAASATAATISAVPSIPVLVAATGMSVATASICATTSRGSTGAQSVTPSEFWAVMAVTAEAPWTRWAAKVRRSAWMPAPPPESEPAMVRATFMPCA